jgi:hypothetical protein
MGFIYQLFADPRRVFGARARPLNKQPTLALCQKQD